MSPSLTAHLHAQMVRALVQKEITCPITGHVLDLRTVAVINDRDGDPAMVLSPDGAASIKNDPKKAAALAKHGYEFAG